MKDHKLVFCNGHQTASVWQNSIIKKYSCASEGDYNCHEMALSNAIVKFAKCKILHVVFKYPVV